MLSGRFFLVFGVEVIDFSFGELQVPQLSLLDYIPTVLIGTAELSWLGYDLKSRW